MTNTAKVILGVVVVATIGGLSYVSIKRSGVKPVEVRTETVMARDLTESVTASGQIEPRTMVNVSADVTGKIVRLAVKEGDMVKRGDFLLQIDPEQVTAALQRSEAALASSQAQAAQSQANLLQATRNFERSSELKKQSELLGVTTEQLEQLKTQVEVNRQLAEAANFGVAQARASVRDAKQALSRTRIVAPMSGRITRLVVEEGETAIQGTLNRDAATLLTISDMSILETKVKVDETDVARISVGDSAIVQIDAFPDTTFVGRVVEISNSSTAATGTNAGDQAVDFEVRVQLLNPPKETRPDFSATAKIVTASRKSALSIPIIALTIRENEALKTEDSALTVGRPSTGKQIAKRDVEGVFVVNTTDNKVTFRPVKVGIAGERHFEVLDGLKAGETIVSGTYQAIRDLKDGGVVRNVKPDDKKAPATGKKS